MNKTVYENTYVRNIPKQFNQTGNHVNNVSETIFIHSSDRSSGTPGKYTVPLPQSYRNITSARLLSAEVPFSVYNIDSTNNTLIIEQSGVLHTLSIEEGLYSTPSQLIDVLNNLVSAYNLVFSVNPLTSKASVSATITTTMKLTPFTSFMGMEVETSVVGGETSIFDNAIDINRTPYLLLSISNLNQTFTTTNAAHDPCIFAKVWMGPCTTQKFSTILYDKKLSETTLNPPISLDRLHIEWLDPYLRPVDFNGFEHSFSLELMCALNTRIN